jgi:hypothetical protein
MKKIYPPAPNPASYCLSVYLEPERHPLDWTLAISRNREALLSVVAGLYAYAGLASGAAFALLPRSVYRAVLQVLRPAESAVRRLIMLAAYDLVVKFGDSLLNSSPVSLSKPKWWLELSKLSPKFPRFQLIDPLKRFAFVNEVTPEAFEFVDFDIYIDPADEVENLSVPRISVPGLLDPVFVAPLVGSADDPINAAHVSLRLAALMRALGTIQSHARRLARWKARRDFALRAEKPFKPVRLSPFRPGSPPGARLRCRYEVDHILRECHLLMLDRLADTS